MRDETADNTPEADVELQALVSRCLGGDSAAIAAFVSKFERFVFGLCLRMLRQREDAEDAAQETFVRAVRNLHRWDSSRPILPWLQTIAANRCRTALSKRTKRPLHTPNLPEPAIVDSTSSDMVEEVDRALATISDQYRDVIVLYYRGGLSVGEISEAIQVADGTVKTWLFRARKELADELRGRGLVGGHDDES